MHVCGLSIDTEYSPPLHEFVSQQFGNRFNLGQFVKLIVNTL